MFENIHRPEKPLKYTRNIIDFKYDYTMTKNQRNFIVYH